MLFQFQEYNPPEILLDDQCYAAYKLQEWVNIDYQGEMCIVASTEENNQGRLIAMASYVKNQANQMADVSFLVHDDFQNCGIGTFLLQRLMQIAYANGIVGFTADVLLANRHMLHIIHKSGCEIKVSLDNRIYHIEFRFDSAKKGSNTKETVQVGA